MSNRRLSSFQNQFSDSPVSRNFKSRHHNLSETLNFSRMSTTFNFADQISSIRENSFDDTLAQQRKSAGNAAADLSSTVHLMDEDDEDEIKGDEISRLVIFQAFFEVCKELKDSSEALNMLVEFNLTCDQNVQAAAEMLSKKLPNDSDSEYLKKFSELIRMERNTWNLFSLLYTDRIEIQGAEEEFDEMDIDEDLRLRLSDSDLFELTLRRNAALREMQLILEWLEKISDEKLDSIEVFANDSMHLEKTFKQTVPGLCSQMDPDGPARTNSKIEDSDKEHENRMFQYMFRLIRRGEIAEAQEVAENFGLFWLSSALDGWKLQHDPNYEPTNSDGTGEAFSSAVKVVEPQTGNSARDLWKLHAWNFAKVQSSNVYERALFAIFSGNRRFLMPLCSTWKDRLWAYFMCSLNVHIEKVFKDTAIDKPDLLPRNTVQMPDEFWENCLSTEEIFNQFEVQQNIGEISTEEKYHETIAKLLILKRIDDLVAQLYDWSQAIVSDRANRKNVSLRNFSVTRTLLSTTRTPEQEEKAKIVEPNLLRFFAHIVIALRQLKLITDPEMNELCLRVLEAYIGYLVEYKLIELAAHYSQFLPRDLQMKTFSSLLATIDNDADRRLCMLVAKQAQMNLPTLLATVVENIQTPTKYHANNTSQEQASSFNRSIFSTTTGMDVTDSTLMKSANASIITPVTTSDDMKRISALDWLILDEENPQYLELLKQINSMVRYFLCSQKVDLAKQALDKAPEDLINKAFAQWREMQQAQVDASSNLSEDGSIDSNSTTVEFDIENAVREFVCHQVFFEAKESFDNWNRCLYQSRPQPPPQPRGALLKLAERVTHEQALKEYEQQKGFWLGDLRKDADVAWEMITKFLTFPFGVWCDKEGENALQRLADPENVEKQYKTNIEDQRQSVDGMSMCSTTTDANAIQTFEAALKRAEMRLVEFPPLKPDCRATQFLLLRRIYIPQYLTLLSTIVRESQQVNKERIFGILNIAESDDLVDCISQTEMASLIMKLNHSWKNRDILSNV